MSDHATPAPIAVGCDVLFGIASFYEVVIQKIFAPLWRNNMMSFLPRLHNPTKHFLSNKFVKACINHCLREFSGLGNTRIIPVGAINGNENTVGRRGIFKNSGRARL